MPQLIVEPTSIRRSAKPGETVTQNFVVNYVPHGNLMATLSDGGSLIRLREFVANDYIERDLTPEEIEALPPDLQEQARLGLFRPSTIVEVGRVGSGEPLSVWPGLKVGGVVEFTAPSTASPTSVNATLVIEGWGGDGVEIPILFVIGDIQVEFLQNPIECPRGESVEVPIRVSLAAGTPITEIKLSSLDSLISIESQRLTVTSGGSATTTLKLLVEEFAELGPTSARLWVDGFSGRTIYIPFQVVIKERIVNPVKGKIILHKYELGGKPGELVSDLEQVVNGYRIRCQNGAIYCKNENEPAFWLSKDINIRYEELGGTQSWLGFPTTDEMPLKDREGGRASSFENGEIYFWDDVGAIELDEVVLNFTGIHCFGETDLDGILGAGSDEVYAIIGIVSPEKKQRPTIMTPIYENVDGGESIVDNIEIYRGKPYGLVLGVILMEHDDENPDRYKAAMEVSCRIAAGLLTAVIGTIPKFGLTLATLAAPILQELAKLLSEELNDLLNLEADTIGKTQIELTCKQMVEYAARKKDFVENGIKYKVATELLSGEGSSYKVYFRFPPF